MYLHLDVRASSACYPYSHQTCSVVPSANCVHILRLCCLLEFLCCRHGKAGYTCFCLLLCDIQLVVRSRCFILKSDCILCAFSVFDCPFNWFCSAQLEGSFHQKRAASWVFSLSGRSVAPTQLVESWGERLHQQAGFLSLTCRL